MADTKDPQTETKDVKPAAQPRSGGIQTNLGVDGLPVEAGTLLGGNGGKGGGEEDV